MAEATARNFEGDQAKFEAEQLKAVESLYGVEPEKMLNEAVEIGVITEKTRDRINQELPDGEHLRLFQRIFERSDTAHENSRRKAFVRSFEAVYGRFLMEDEESEKNESGLDKASLSNVKMFLEKVLRFPIDDKTVFKGRPELQAVIRRLRMLGAERKIGEKITNDLPQIEAERNKACRRVTELEEKDLRINTTLSQVALIDVTTDIEANLQELANLQSEDQVLADQFAFLGQEKRDNLPNERSEARNKLISSLRDIESMQVLFDEITNILVNDCGYVEDDVRPTREEFQQIVSEFHDSLQPTKYRKFDILSLQRLQIFYNQRLRKFLRKIRFKDNPVLAAKIGQFRKLWQGVEANRDAIPNFKEVLQEVRDTKTQYKQIGSSRAEIKNDIQDAVAKIVSKLDAMIPTIQSLKTPEFEHLVSGITDDCDEYLQRLEELKQEDPDSLSETDLRNFVNNHYKPFLLSVSQKITTAKEQNAQHLEQVKSDIRQFDDEIEKQKGMRDRLHLVVADPIMDCLQGAFPGIKIVGGTIKIHGFETSFTHVAKVLKAAQDYFESPEEMSALRDSHRDLSNLIEKSSNEAFREELSSTDVGFKPEDFDKGIQAQINKLEAKIDAIKRSTIQDQKNATEDQRVTNERLREARAEKVGRLSEALRVLKDNLDAAKRLHAEMQKLIKKLGVVMKAGLNVVVNGNPLGLSTIIEDFKKIDLRGTDFQPSQLLGVYKMFGDYFESDTNVAGFASEIEKAKKEVTSSTDLTDAAAAKKIIAVMVARQFPEAGLEEQQKIAAMVLAGDIATLHTDLGYNALAQRASAELLDTVSQAGFKEKLIGLRYKDGEKTEQPFKDLKPENFKDWASIEKLFTIGRLNHQNGFLVLAALEIFDGDVRSVQSVRTERKLKELLAKQLGVDERMDEAGVNKIVNDAFKDQIKKVRPLVATYFGHYDTHAAEWSGYKVKELNLRYEKLQEERRLGKVGEALYGKRMAELVKEAQEANVMSQVDFSQDSVMAGYWDSPEAQWLRDRGHDVGKYAGHKALALGKGSLRVAGRALLGTAGLAGSLAVNTAFLPFRVAKYPLMLAAKPLVGFINLFRSSKWQPFSIVGSVRTDLGRVGGYFSGKASGVWTGTQNAVKAVPEELGYAKYESKKYKDRTSVDMAALEAEAKELREKAEATPITIAGSPFIDLQKYKDQVAKLDRILAGGGGGAGSGGGAAKKEAA